jgi:hypothetical protein
MTLGVAADRSHGVLRSDTFSLSMLGSVPFQLLLPAHLNALREARRVEPLSRVPPQWDKR